ncbi:hypothetical protein [Bacillus toyonensis]|uniref:hypothetical protein n=1 Tax=Bacillus toyonensis TaxID=155322 RepID=UPI002E1BA7D3|nr:hypothetical protein [Bacillus toyonensis]
MFKEITLTTFKNYGFNILELENAYHFINELGRIICYKDSHQFIISDCLMESIVVSDKLIEMCNVVKKCLVNETIPFMLSLVMTESNTFFNQLEFINVTKDEESRLKDQYEKINSIYQIKGGCLYRYQEQKIRPKYLSSNVLAVNNLSIGFNPKTLSLTLQTTGLEGFDYLLDVNGQPYVLYQLFDLISTSFSERLSLENIQHSIKIGPFGFEIQFHLNEELNLCFEMNGSEYEQMRFVISEYVKQTDEYNIDTDFFDGWFEFIYVNRKNGKLHIQDNGLIRFIQRREALTFFVPSV